MKISIITPTHNPVYLKELEQTILNNTYQNWEWIILLNNGAKYKATDKRIKIIQSKTNSTKVGALKKEACSYAIGEVIAEVDHDDLITSDCLAEVVKAFENKNIGFVFSENAKLSDDFKPYNPYYGWTYKKYNHNGKELFAMNNQPVTPGRLGYIWFAPDHIRAWRKSTYDEIGGHNENLSICDDQDLMHRLYLVTEFKAMDKVLYIYRITGENTWLERNQEIQQTTVNIYHQNIEKLAFRFSELNGLKNIDLCGGFNSPKGYTSIDLQNADIITNLNNGIPLPDNSCGIVRAFDALEHLRDIQFTMKEIHRVLAPGGILLSRTPSTDGRGAWQDPTHVSFWNENSFWYWTRPEQMQFIHNTRYKFFESSLRTFFPSKWHKDNKISYVEANLEKI